MAKLWKVVTGAAAGVFVYWKFLELRQSSKEMKEAEDELAKAAAETAAIDAIKEEERKRRLDPANFPQGTFWNRAEICHLALFRHLERIFDLNQRGKFYEVTAEFDLPPYYCKPGVLTECFGRIGSYFIRWNLTEGTFDYKWGGDNGNDNILFKRIEPLRSRLVALNFNSVRIAYPTDPFERKEYKKFHCIQIPLLQTANTNADADLVDLRLINWKERTGNQGSTSHVAISDLLDPEKTTTADFQKMFSTPQSISCSTTNPTNSANFTNLTDLVHLAKMVDDTFCDATQLPTALRQLTLNYAN